MSWRSRFRHVICGHDGLPMLIRYRFLDTRWGALYVHHFLRSDQDRDLHDHPWNFISLILWGGYFEELPHDWRWRSAGRIVRHKATDAHRVLLPYGSTAWTLIWVSPKVREWGFHTENGWVPWEEYVRREQ